jgi:predicted amidohydrolase
MKKSKGSLGDNMRIALAQTDVYWEDKERNKEKFIKFIEEAKVKDADIVIFPEMTLTGFSQKVYKIGEENGETIEWFKEQSNVHSIYTCFGHVEGKREKGKNNLSIVSSKGELITTYTKLHPFSYSGEDEFYYKGEQITLFNINEVKASAFICYDLRFPEIFQIASKKAELIIVIANWPESRRDAWITLLRARAIENQCFIAGVNRVGIGDGIKYSGDSMVIDPKGNILVSSHEKEELLICDIDTEEVKNIRERFPYKKDRREELYIKSFEKHRT